MNAQEQFLHAKGTFKGIGIAAEQELENIESSIAAAKALIQSLEDRKRSIT